MPDRNDWIQPTEDRPNKLMRAQDDRMIAGVCGGIAKFFNWPANRVRAVYVVVSVLSAAFPGILVYMVLWLLMPSEGKPGSPGLH